MIKLSVITPTFNRKEKLKANLESVARLSGLLSFEHIIIDNFSDDGTREMVESYMPGAGYPVKYIREKDSGIFQAMNKGIRAASGEWLHFLNSDDIYFPHFSLKKLEGILDARYDIVAGSIKKGSTLESARRRDPAFDPLTKYHMCPHQGLFIKRTFFESHGLYSEKYKVISDSVYAAEHFGKAKIKYIDDVLVFQKDGGITTSGKFIVEKEKLLLVWKHMKSPLSVKWEYLLRFLKISVAHLKAKIKYAISK